MSDPIWQQPTVQVGDCVIARDGFETPDRAMLVTEVNQRFLRGIMYTNGGARQIEQAYHKTSPDLGQHQFNRGHVMWEHSKQTKRQLQIENDLKELHEKVRELMAAVGYIAVKPGHEFEVSVGEPAPLAPPTPGPRGHQLDNVATPVETHDRTEQTELEAERDRLAREEACRQLIKHYVEVERGTDLHGQVMAFKTKVGLHHSTVRRLMNEYESANAAAV